MALIPIWFGSKRALKNRVKRLKDKAEGKTGDDLGKGKNSNKALKFFPYMIEKCPGDQFFELLF